MPQFFSRNIVVIAIVLCAIGNGGTFGLGAMLVRHYAGFSLETMSDGEIQSRLIGTWIERRTNSNGPVINTFKLAADGNCTIALEGHSTFRFEGTFELKERAITLVVGRGAFANRLPVGTVKQLSDSRLVIESQGNPQSYRRVSGR
jgi:hypothetical protein